MNVESRYSVLMEKMRLVFLACKSLSNEFHRMDDASLHKLLTRYNYEEESIHWINEFATCVELIRRRGGFIFDEAESKVDSY